MIAASTLAFSGPTTPHAAAAAVASGNMNGKYSVASGDRQDVAFNDDYASKGHEYFDVWGPEIATHYAEVFWTDQGYNPLPEHIIKRFANKTMAITGYEMDQVMVRPVGHPGVNASADVSVPINWAYNHHYMMWVTGAGATMERVAADPDDVSAHGAPTKWQAVELPGARPTRTGCRRASGSRRATAARAASPSTGTPTALPSCSIRRRSGTSTRCRSTRATATAAPRPTTSIVASSSRRAPSRGRPGMGSAHRPTPTTRASSSARATTATAGTPPSIPRAPKRGRLPSSSTTPSWRYGGACDDHAAVNSALDCWAAAQVLGLNASKHRQPVGRRPEGAARLHPSPSPAPPPPRSTTRRAPAAARRAPRASARRRRSST